MYGPPPPPPPPPDPGARLHDGFFLRLGLGLGFGNVSVDSEEPGGVQHEGEIRGMGFGLEVLLGGTPASGLVLGGGFLGHSIPEPTFEIDGVEYDDYGIDFNLFVFPIFLNYYPNPRTGLNLQALGGIAASYFTWDDPYTDDQESSDTAWGGAVAAGIGYEGWVGSKWSLGGAFRLMYASTSMKDGDSFLGTWDYSYSQIFTTLSFVATMH
jgi:hypothetical protein